VWGRFAVELYEGDDAVLREPMRAMEARATAIRVVRGVLRERDLACRVALIAIDRRRRVGKVSV